MLVKQEKKETTIRKKNIMGAYNIWALKFSLAACFPLTSRAHNPAPEARDPISQVRQPHRNQV